MANARVADPIAGGGNTVVHAERIGGNAVRQLERKVSGVSEPAQWRTRAEQAKEGTQSIANS
jgi:hypothetical protein